MISDVEMERMDTLTANLGEHFKDYVVLVRTERGTVSWRSSCPVWAEGATRNYLNYIQTGNHLQQMDEFYGRDR